MGLVMDMKFHQLVMKIVSYDTCKTLKENFAFTFTIAQCERSLVVILRVTPLSLRDGK